MNNLKAQGFDGIIQEEFSKDIKYQPQRDDRAFIVFDSEQIKSVDNRGTFDAQNPNIYYQNLQPIEIEKDAVPEFEKISELKKWIENELNLLGEVTIKENNKVVQFSKSNVARSLKGISRNEAKKQSYSKLKELVENSVFTTNKEADERHKERNKGQEIYHNAFIYDGKTYGIEIAFDIPKSDNSLGSYAGHKIKIIKTPEVNEVSSKEGLLDLTGANISINDIRELFNHNIKEHEESIKRDENLGKALYTINKEAKKLRDIRENLKKHLYEQDTLNNDTIDYLQKKYPNTSVDEDGVYVEDDYGSTFRTIEELDNQIQDTEREIEYEENKINNAQEDEPEQQNIFPGNRAAKKIHKVKGGYLPAEKFIKLFRNADASTIVHECAHWYLDELTRIAQYNEEVAEDLEAIRKFLKNEGEEFTREQHEKFVAQF
ncbi:hypothetical protein IJ425_08125 [bacterium]|nr:hypothetical protein [bacterium]